MTAPTFSELEELACCYGRSYESYLVTEPERECFWLPDRRGAVAFLRQGRYLHVGGGLLAAESDWPVLLNLFVERAGGQGVRLLFYNIASEALHARPRPLDARKTLAEGRFGLKDMPAGA